MSPKTVEEFVPPTDEIRDKIVTQVEFYFSDANVLKDAFLLKHIRRNKMGYVSIKLITSFKKVKTLTKDYRVVAHSLKHSKKLEVNEEGTKVRRIDPLPDYDETTPSRTVVAVNLPMENPSIESVAELFSKCGDIVLIRILKPGKPVPPDIKKHAHKHPEIDTATCAIVEFEKHESAKKCADTMTDKNDWRNGLRVMVLAVKKKKDEEKEKGECHGDGSDDNKKQRKRGGRKKKLRIDELAKENDSSNCSSGSEGESSNTKASSLSPRTPDFDSNRLSPKSSPRTSPRNSPHNHRRKIGHGKSPLADENKFSPRSSPEMDRKRIDSFGSTGTPSSPWVKRRLQAAKEMQDNGSPAVSPHMGRRNFDGSVVTGLSPRMLDMTNVIRQPRGPDGSKGFYGGIGRGKPRSHTVA
ncbi:hypothetical protein LOTGIDRAFT_112382 [Lottia gigantea]|uniref:Uncharacterized protein n=1 Tax=Lottia gigantea TaxID=225164 RepID=V4ATL7_LOTGI|nr:hypothetical protein LOTGIDRAFT_112382 [Lottia gigantea]ESP00643.1 hypothetical protein LOTGIDRAFT_112382 [Lottia gigantea]